MRTPARSRPSIMLLVLHRRCSGIVYPLAVTGVAPGRRSTTRPTARSSKRDGTVVGSRADRPARSPTPQYFQPRPSAAGDGYDAARRARLATSGPTNPDLLDAVEERVAAYRRANGLAADADGAGRRGDRVGLRASTRTSRSPTPGCRRRGSPRARGLTVGEVHALDRRAHRRPLARLPRRAGGQRARAQPRARRARRERRRLRVMARGTLRVYLGAAPGVGKTYAMLNEGRRRHERGTDVVVGFVETHGRPHTAAQIGDLEVVPRTTHRRTAARRSRRWTSTPSSPASPQVALVDELAHTNVPGLPQREALAGRRGAARRRHRRHLDASTSSTSSRSTTSSSRSPASRSARRSPTRSCARADQIELVDMTPEALRRRMAHGNIYAAEKVDAALGNYFRVGQPRRAARARAAVGRRPGRRGARRTTASAHGIDRPVGDARAGRRRAHRRAGRRATSIRRAARMAHARARATCSACTSVRATGWPAPTGRCSSAQRAAARGARRRRTTRSSATTSPTALVAVRPRRERHPARARREPAVALGRAARAGR